MLAGLTLAGSVVAQSTDTQPATDTLKPPVTIVAPKGNTSADKPARPELPYATPDPAVRALVERFQTAREDFIKKQKPSLICQRDAARLEWLEKRSVLTEELRNRAMEIKNEFRNRELQEVLDAARDAARQAKPRAGED